VSAPASSSARQTASASREGAADADGTGDAAGATAAEVATAFSLAGVVLGSAEGEGASFRAHQRSERVAASAMKWRMS
jgi:hypothetical protein